jgi:MFS family permease
MDSFLVPYKVSNKMNFNQNPLSYTKKFDAILVTSCLALALNGYFQAFLGSAMPIIRENLDLSVEMVGWHFSVYAIGRMSAGSLLSALSRQINPRWIMVIFSSVLVILSAAITLIEVMFLTLSIAYIIGVSVGLLAASTQLRIAGLEQKDRELVLAKAYVWASIGVMVCPFLTSISLQGKEFAILSMVSILVVSIVLSYKLIKSEPEYSMSQKKSIDSRFSMTVICFWLLVFFGNSLEWSFGFWGAQYLQEKMGKTSDYGIKMMTLFFFGTIVGRILNVRLVKKFDCDNLNVSYMIIYAVSFYILYSSNFDYVIYVTVFILGATSGCLYPNNMAAALKYAPNESMRIAAGAAKCSGLSLLISPLIVGYAAGHFGLVESMRILQFMPFIIIFLVIAMRLKTVRRQPL